LALFGPILGSDFQFLDPDPVFGRDRSPGKFFKTGSRITSKAFEL
jgi:hypothetical protein